MSPNASSVFVCVLLFLVLAVKTDSQECGQSTYKSITDPSVKVTEKGYATEGMWPWMVAIRKKISTGGSEPWCSGFLIDKKHVLSPAHCYEKDTELFRARIGHVNQDKADEYRITGIAIPKSYKRGFFYSDIAVLTLDREVSFPKFSPICLPDEQVSGMNLTGKSAVHAGWTSNYPIAPEYDKKILLNYRTDVKIMSNQDCEVVFRQQLSHNVFDRQFPQGINKGLLCGDFSEESQDICMGSGGPAMIKNGNKWFAVGIDAFGIRCGSPGEPEGFTSVINFLNWIRKTIKD